MAVASFTSSPSKEPTPYGSFEEFAMELKRVMAADYGIELSNKEVDNLARWFDTLLCSML